MPSTPISPCWRQPRMTAVSPQTANRHRWPRTRAIPARPAWLDPLSAALIGVLLASPMGSQYILVFGSNYVPEVGVAAILFLNGAFDRSFLSKLIAFLTSPAVAAWSLVCIILMLIGTAFHHDFIAAYSNFRTCLALGYAFIFAADIMNSNPNRVEFLVQISILALISSIVFYEFLNTATTPKRLFPVGTLIFLTFVSLKRKSVGFSFLVLAIGAYSCVTSAYRSNLILFGVLAVAQVFALLFPISDVRRGKGRILDRVSLAIGALVSIVAAPLLIQMVMGYLRSDPGRYHQTIYKFQLMFDAIRAGRPEQADSIRAEYVPYIGRHFLEFLLPSGFGSDAITYDWRSAWTPAEESMGFGASVDGGHVFMAVHFGLFLSAALVIFVAARAVWALPRCSPSEIAIRVLLWLAMGVFFVTFGGHAFAQLPVAIGAGLAFATLSASPTARNVVPSVRSGRAIPQRTAPESLILTPVRTSAIRPERP